METILIVAFVLIALMIAHENRKKIEAPVITEKRCPPHKWNHVEIKDHKGVVHAHRLMCVHCGPLRAQDETPRKMDN